jgi:predicted Zn finger-like uncharacterized protein
MVEIDGFEEIRPGTMYTQCPECSTAFRVTADVLKQAAGNVRCGGCGSAFNALDYLSEAKPAQPPRREAEAALPELKPDPVEDDDGLPAAISAEQSAALLKTLDELAGSDIRIEDTGVEWRVLDDDEIGEAADDEIAIDVEVEDQPQIDEILDESPTPVDQFLTDTPPEIDSPEIFAEGNTEPGQTPVDELRFDDNTPLPDDFGLDDDEPYVPAAEPEPEPIAAVSEQADLDLSEPDEWTDILDEFEDLASDLAAPDQQHGEERAERDDETPAEHDDAAPEDHEEVVYELAASDEDDDLAADALLDMDSQFALQAEAMGIELSGAHEMPAAEEEIARDELDDLDTLLEEHSVAEPDLEDLLEEEVVDEIEEEAAQLELIGDEEDADEAGSGAPDETRLDFDIPPMTDEEQTINLQIDQDLLAIAVEDEDGFASTMVLAENAAGDLPTGEDAVDEAGTDHGEGAREDAAGVSLLDTSAGFETIIMEGEHVRSEHDDDDLAVQAAAVASLADAAAAERATADEGSGGKTRYGMVAGIVVLLALLGGQYLHQSRNTLATIPAFNNVAGPVYRAIGQPLSPAWDITGWRFEATKGSTSEDDQNLTVYSRIGNNADQPLPYPLISISLTDRFEETIGSRVLDPADYLPDDLDPSKLVQPGNTFNAVITISSPDANAVSFRLRACYRAAGGQLRCKDDGFK